MRRITSQAMKQEIGPYKLIYYKTIYRNKISIEHIIKYIIEMDKIIFTNTLLTNNSKLENLKYHFNSKNINMFDFLNDSYEITTNINDQINKITVRTSKSSLYLSSSNLIHVIITNILN